MSHGLAQGLALRSNAEPRDRVRAHGSHLPGVWRLLTAYRHRPGIEEGAVDVEHGTSDPRACLPPLERCRLSAGQRRNLLADRTARNPRAIDGPNRRNHVAG